MHVKLNVWNVFSTKPIQRTPFTPGECRAHATVLNNFFGSSRQWFFHSLCCHRQTIRNALCKLPAFISQRHDHFLRMEPPMATTDKYKCSPLSLCINDWNSLPNDLVRHFVINVNSSFAMSVDLPSVWNWITLLLLLNIIGYDDFRDFTTLLSSSLLCLLRLLMFPRLM